MFEKIRAQLASQGEVSFTVRVHPGAKRTAVRGAMADGTVKIDVAAAPEDGKANTALIQFLAGEFGVPKSHVVIFKGQTSKTKAVRIRARITAAP